MNTFLRILLLIIFTLSPIHGIDEDFLIESESYLLDNLVEKINETLKKVGIDKGFVQEEGGKIVLKGKYKNYDEFVSAYMIAQAIAGVSKVSPVYDIVKSTIVERNLERCIAFAMLGYPEKCKNFIPYAEGLSSSKDNKVALLIGVGTFKYGINPLGDAPLNDVELVSKILEKRGYKVYTLLNEEATYDNVMKLLNKIISEIPDGGTFFFYASTHGSPKSPDGETGVVLYDTSVVGRACSTLDKSVSTDVRDIVITAKRMCNFLNNSLTLVEDIIPLLSASGKNIKFIASLDICYSGRALKPYLGNILEEAYATDYESALRISGYFPYAMIYISSASGEQSALQTSFNGKEHGIFTYYFFTQLPEEQYNTFVTFKKIKKKVAIRSAKECRKIKRSFEGVKCDERGQTPIYIQNKDSIDPRL